MKIKIIFIPFTTSLPSSSKIKSPIESSDEEEREFDTLQEAYNVLYHESYELKVENMKLKKVLNKIKTLIEFLEFEKNDSNEKLNFYGSQKN